MPQPIIRTDPRTGEQRQWDGSTWQPMPHVTTPMESLGNFLSGAISTTPFNPMNIVRAVEHPLDTVSSIVTDPFKELYQAAVHAKNAVTNPGNEGLTGRAAELAQAIEHASGAVPLVGTSAIHAGEDIGHGDVARGTGELAGLASSALLPEAKNRAPGVIDATGQGMERAGTALGDSKIGGYGLPGLAVMESLLRSDPKGLAIAAAPTLLKYGGKGLQGLADLLGVNDTPSPEGFRPSVAKTVNWSGPDVTGDFERATRPQSTESYWSQSGPNTEFQAGEPRLVKTGSPSLEDHLTDVLNGLSDESTSSPAGDTPSVRSTDRGNQPDWYQSWLDKNSGPAPEFEMDGVTYRPDASGSHVAVQTPAAVSSPRPVMPEDIGYGANGDLGAGISAGNDSMLPSEYRVEDESWYTKPTAAPATSGPSSSNMPESLQAIDRLFGPGTKDLGGEPFQSTTGGPGTGSNNLLYDPQTPSDYLREQAQAPETPDADREFLLRALRQRLRLGQSAGYQDIIPQ